MLDATAGGSLATRADSGLLWAAMAPGGTDQGKKLKGRLARGEGFTVVRLEGVIDEHNELARLTSAIGQGDTLLIDLGGIKRLNSVGVRDWVNWLRGLRAAFETIVLFDCPPPVMCFIAL